LRRLRRLRPSSFMTGAFSCHQILNMRRSAITKEKGLGAVLRWRESQFAD